MDDVVQEALILAFAKVPAFDRTQPFGPWVRGIARRHPAYNTHTALF